MHRPIPIAPESACVCTASVQARPKAHASAPFLCRCARKRMRLHCLRASAPERACLCTATVQVYPKVHTLHCLRAGASESASVCPISVHVRSKAHACTPTPCSYVESACICMASVQVRQTLPISPREGVLETFVAEALVRQLYHPPIRRSNLSRVACGEGTTFGYPW
jgi:hypothetical protein